MALKITEPQNEAELSDQREITFKGTADNSIHQVEIYADVYPQMFSLEKALQLSRP